MDFEESQLLDAVPTTSKCNFCLGCGTKLIAILGILTGLTCTTIILLKDRKYLTTSSSVLIIFLSMFIVVTIMFVVASVLLLLAALDDDSELMSYYISITIVNLCLQVILAVAIPIVLIVDGRSPFPIAMTWMVITLIVGLGWMHFVSVLSSYKTILFRELPMMS